MTILTNPAVLAIFAMILLCLARFNVFLSIISAALIAGILAKFKAAEEIVDSGFSAKLNALTTSIVDTMKLMIEGMSGQLETALSYAFLGILAVAISRGNLIKVLVYKLSTMVNKKNTLFCFIIAFVACFSQNLVPVHVAFIPILIPPILAMMNKMKLDRRAIACALAFGLEAPYVCLPVGFGLIYHNIIKKEMLKQGIEVSNADIAGVMWIAGVAMLFGLLIAILILYRKPREYTQEKVEAKFETLSNIKLQTKDYLALFSIVIAFVIQIIFSLALGAFIGIVCMILFGVIEWKKMDKVLDQGLASMALIAFIMLVASGFGAVLKSTGGINELVTSVASLVDGKIGGALLMLLVGLFVTMGIGTSFGTLPILAVVYCPLGLELGFSASAIILLLGIAGALGDSGSAASDTTIGPTMGLNADGQHNHIWDTCVPTFIVYNIPLLVFGVFGAWMLG